MNIGQIKQYIFSVLVYKQDNLAISPDLIIDRLVDVLDLGTVQTIAGFAESATNSSTDVKQLCWDRYLMPRLAQADMYVKVFARV